MLRRLRPKQYTYPYSPDASWRIAVSRRFNVPAVDDFYFGCVLPVLQAEGCVLECKFADETSEQYNYWMNRFSLILELSDIHVLIDFERSPNMEYEFNRSMFIARNGVTPSLSTNFGIGILRSRDFIKTIRLYLTQNTTSNIPKIGRQRIISINGTHEEISNNIAQALQWAKRVRLFDLNLAINFYEKMWARIGWSELGDIKKTLISMTQIASGIDNNSTFEALNVIAKSSEMSIDYSTNIVRRNKIKEWEAEFYNGQIELPEKYLDKVKYFKNMYRNNIAESLKDISQFDIPPPIWILDTRIGKIVLYLMAIRGLSNMNKRLARLKRQMKNAGIGK